MAEVAIAFQSNGNMYRLAEAIEAISQSKDCFPLCDASYENGHEIGCPNDDYTEGGDS